MPNLPPEAFPSSLVDMMRLYRAFLTVHQNIFACSADEILRARRVRMKYFVHYAGEAKKEEKKLRTRLRVALL